MSAEGDDHRRVQRPRTSWSLAIRAVLADGEWHERAELLEAALPTVPPMVAYRRGEKHRKMGGACRPGPDQRKDGDHNASIKVGAKRVVMDVLRSMVKTGAVERDGDRYRLGVVHQRRPTLGVAVKKLLATAIGDEDEKVALASHLGVSLNTTRSWAQGRYVASTKHWGGIETFFGWEPGTIASAVEQADKPQP